MSHRVEIKPIIALVSIFALWVSCVPLTAMETPSSDGPVALVDEPVFRIPMLRHKPEVDGKLGEKEWGDASALSSFWVNNAAPLRRPRYEYLAPHQIQSQVFAGYDKKNLYLLYKIKKYPVNAWLKARGRFPDVWKHPLYGIKQDDHLEFELRPYHDNREAFGYGFFKWFVNPLGVVADMHHSVQYGEGKRWQSDAKVRVGITPNQEWWFAEMEIPFEKMKHWGYAGKNKEGRDVLPLPPPDESTYRVWFKNGIGGAGHYVILFDQHPWRVTKTKMILDSSCVAFQINDLGPMMEDVIDVKLTLKNHSTKSETVRLGFFVENAEGNIFSSYEHSATSEGMVELSPGTSKEIRFKKKFPGISEDGNYVWFDVRSAGQPAKILFQNRIAKFHNTEPPPPEDKWKELKLDILSGMRPVKKDYDFGYQFSPYTHKLSAHVDKGIYSAPDEVRAAVEAQLIVSRANEDEDEIASEQVKFNGNFATFMIQLPKDLEIGNYNVSLLLFDENQMIVGESNPRHFYKGKFEWEHNTLGREDIVWEPYRAIERKEQTLDTLKVKYTLDASGLPAQLRIKADEHELPLEVRGKGLPVSAEKLMSIGRGDQLRSPFRFEAVVGGTRHTSRVVKAAEVIKKWKSEHELKSKIQVGPIDVELTPRYDCDGTLHIAMKYGAKSPVEVDLFEMVVDVDGHVDSRIGGLWGMTPNSGTQIDLPYEPGIVWDSGNHDHLEPLELFYSRFVPYFTFGSGDRGFTWACDSDRGWILDKTGTSMTLERDKDMKVTWRVKFVNHKAQVSGYRDIRFFFKVSPSKSIEKGHRKIKWLYWRPEAYVEDQLKSHPNDRPWGFTGTQESYAAFRKTFPRGGPRIYTCPWMSSGQPELQKRAYLSIWGNNPNAAPNNSSIDEVGTYGQPWNLSGEDKFSANYGCDSFADFTVYWKEKQIRECGITGWWWDNWGWPTRGKWPANDGSYFRSPEQVGDKEIPWQANFNTLIYVDVFKRLARLFKKNKVPNYQSVWAGTHPDLCETFVNSSQMMESAAACHLSHEIDNITRFPIKFFRHMANTQRGVITRINPVPPYHPMPGDDLRFDRAILGRALIHDIAAAMSLHNYDQLVRVKNILKDFGAFEAEDTEFIPYWRSGDLCRYGEAKESEGFAAKSDDPNDKVYISIFRRPYKKVGEVQGYKTLMIILNENDDPVRGRLHIMKPKQVWGGDNNLTGSFIYNDLPAPPDTFLKSRYFKRHALIDAETKGIVAKAGKDKSRKEVRGNIYGPLFIPGHNFRIIYGHYRPKVSRDISNVKFDAKYKNLKGKAFKEEGYWWDNWNRVVNK